MMDLKALCLLGINFCAGVLKNRQQNSSVDFTRVSGEIDDLKEKSSRSCPDAFLSLAHTVRIC